jgi:hypothetical protein
VYKEYKVIKQNRVGKKQNRKMGIDSKRIYNLPDTSASNVHFTQHVKRKYREMTDVVKAERLKVKGPQKYFQILFRDLASNAIIAYKYEAASEYECAEIVAKIDFLCKPK